MFGPDYLVAPILEVGQRMRRLYLPKGTDWKALHDERRIEGGQWVEAPAPLDVIPVFVRS